MNFDEFTGTVQHRLELSGTGESVRAIRATLLTLGRRIPAGNAEDLAASLPMEIKWYLTGAIPEEDHGERFDWAAFVDRVADIEGIDPSEAAFHARVIVDLVASCVPESDVRELRAQLLEADENWDQLFELVDEGGWDELHEAPSSGGPQTR